MAKFNDRTHSIFIHLGITAVTNASSGRYLRSAVFRPGVRYWAGFARRKDLLGVQFLGEGLSEAVAYRQALANEGFASRTPQPSQLTFCREIDFLPDDKADLVALSAAKSAIDKILK